MKNKEIQEKLNAIIYNVSGNNISIEDDINLVDDLSFDSLMIMELIMEIEDEFKITFDDSMFSISRLSSYSKILEYILCSIED